MENAGGGGEGGLETGPGRGPDGGKARARAAPLALTAGVRFAAFLCAVFFAAYAVGGAYVQGVPDATLFAFLRLLRASAILLSALSLAAMGFCVRRAALNPGVRAAARVLPHFFLALLGGVLVVFSLLVVAVTQAR